MKANNNAIVEDSTEFPQTSFKNAQCEGYIWKVDYSLL